MRIRLGTAVGLSHLALSLLAPMELAAGSQLGTCSEALNWRNDPGEIDRGAARYLEVISSCVDQIDISGLHEAVVARGEFTFPIYWWDLPVMQLVFDDGRSDYGWSHTVYDFEASAACIVNLQLHVVRPELLNYDNAPLFVREEYDRLSQAIAEYEAVVETLLKLRLAEISARPCSEDWDANTQHWLDEIAYLHDLTEDGRRWGVYFKTD